jgi:hypothetical protein
MVDASSIYVQLGHTKEVPGAPSFPAFIQVVHMNRVTCANKYWNHYVQAAQHIKV